MVELEWDGIELPASARRSLRDRVRSLASLVDPDGRARLAVEIVDCEGTYTVSVAGKDERRRVGAQAEGVDLAGAIDRAFGLAFEAWRGVRRGPR